MRIMELRGEGGGEKKEKIDPYRSRSTFIQPHTTTGAVPKLVLATHEAAGLAGRDRGPGGVVCKKVKMEKQRHRKRGPACWLYTVQCFRSRNPTFQGYPEPADDHARRA